MAINLEDIDWTERAIRIHGKGARTREMFFSRRVSRYLDDYLKRRGEPTTGPLFITARKARSPRRADLTADGHARLSYRQADTLWKKYTPGWDLHRLRHTAISAGAAQGYTEVELKRFSGHPIPAQPRGVHRLQPRGCQAQSARLGTPRQHRAVDAGADRYHADVEIGPAQVCWGEVGRSMSERVRRWVEY
ncbi:MAG: site-specific integrase [Chloroflexi bacterium]|nr:site-specific integrase [Chloroflexota bacterium]